MAAAKKRVKRKIVSDVHGKVFVRATFNNVIVTVTDIVVVGWKEWIPRIEEEHSVRFTSVGRQGRP